MHSDNRIHPFAHVPTIPSRYSVLPSFWKASSYHIKVNPTSPKPPLF